VRNFFTVLAGAAAGVALGVFVFSMTSPARAQAQKKYKNNAEFEVYDAVAKDIGANNWAKALANLDKWKQEFADSEYKDDRTLLYVQVYNGANQPAKSLETAAELLARDIDSIFAPGDVIKLLFNAASAITRLTSATADQLANGGKAARQLISYNKMPPGTPAAAWDQARAEMQRIGRAALMYIAILPGNIAMAKTPKDCATAESAYTKALSDYPDNVAISFNLGSALSCLKRNPEAVYHFERASVLDPSLGKTADPLTIQKFADNAYARVRGSDDGLAQLKEQVKQSPMPPAGFTIKNVNQIAAEKEAELEKNNPQIAMWMKIRSALADANGDQYFEGTLKNAGVPQLKGTLAGANPACRPKELLVAVGLPDAPGTPTAEITLKLDKPLTGKPDLNSEIRWQGVPSAFTRDPFMLTMDTESAKVEGVKTTPCAAPGPGKKGAPKKN
jgi:tetratricopeptide (TPR) repeat protein